MRVAASILACDLSDLRTEIKRVEEAGVDSIHFDVMDGHFVPNLTFGVPLIRCLRPITKLPFDVHLMVTNPLSYVNELLEVGVQMISFHVEAEVHSEKLISLIKNGGAKASMTLNPGTSLSHLGSVLQELDNVLLMTVNPGFYGQEFILSSFRKIKELSDWQARESLEFSIQVDGGVNVENASKLKNLGVDEVVTGASLFKSKDYRAAVNSLRG